LRVGRVPKSNTEKKALPLRRKKNLPPFASRGELTVLDKEGTSPVLMEAQKKREKRQAKKAISQHDRVEEWTAYFFLEEEKKALKKRKRQFLAHSTGTKKERGHRREGKRQPSLKERGDGWLVVGEFDPKTGKKDGHADVKKKKRRGLKKKPTSVGKKRKGGKSASSYGATPSRRGK